MFVRRALLLACALVAVASLVQPATAPADAFDDVLAVYERDGDIDPCAFTLDELREARQQMPDEVVATNPQFPAALDSAIASRDVECEDRSATTGPDGAAGEVPPGGVTLPGGPTAPGGVSAPAGPTVPTGPTAATPPATTPPAPAPDPTLASSTASATETVGRTGTWQPALIIVLSAIGGLLLLAGLLAALGSRLGWFEQGGPLAGVRHAGREAGMRIGLTWAEFSDWVRLGR